MKHWKRMGLGLACLGLAGVIMLAAGCASTPKKSPRAFNLELKKDQGPVAIDLAGINDYDKADWEAYPVSKYWEPNDPFRRNAREIIKTFKNLKDGETVTIPEKDPVWQSWFSRGATCVVVMADLPGNLEKGGGPDPRRKIIDLDKKTNKGVDRILIEVKQGIVRVTPIKD